MSNSETALLQLIEIMRRLRDPVNGCDWDREQTFDSISPFTIEEAYEVADAIERRDLMDLKDELGDLLFQVIFHSQIATEINAFTFNDVAQSIVDKLIRRHPHVFGNAVFESKAQLKVAWEAIKSEERSRKAQFSTGQEAQAAAPSALDGVANNLPALKYADKMQKRAARVGFDWPDIHPVWKKLSEEIDEVQDALERGDRDAIEDELGDLLFTVVNLSRHLAIDPENALRRSTRKFEKRFRCVEKIAQDKNLGLLSLNDSELDALWVVAKREAEKA